MFKNRHAGEDNIIGYLDRHAMENPHLPAFSILDADTNIERSISFLKLSESVRWLSGKLYAQALSSERVLMVYQDVIEFIIAFLACQHAGVVSVPMTYLKNEKDFMKALPVIKDAGVMAILCQHRSVKQLERFLPLFKETMNLSLIGTDAAASMKSRTTSTTSAAGAISFIQYTSGSTGEPKGVTVSMKSLLHNQRLLGEVFGCDSESVIFSWLPFQHDMGLIGNILHAVYSGCTCLLMSGFLVMQSPIRWLKAISKYRVTHSGGPNFAYDFCVDRISPNDCSSLDLSCWQVAYNGSEPVKASTMHRFADFFKTAGFDIRSFFPCYGLAEATLLVSGKKELGSQFLSISIDRGIAQDGVVRLAAQQNESLIDFISCGAVPKGMNLLVVANSREVCGELQVGEICVAGDSVTEGYWNQDNRPFYLQLGGRHYFRTGDNGFLYEGQLFVFGRVKEMVIVRGRNFYLSDIEDTIARSHNAILTNGVAFFEVSEGSNKYAAVLEVKRNIIGKLNVIEVIEAVKKTVFGNYGIALSDVVLTSPLVIPRTTSGKIQHARCMQYYRNRRFKTLISDNESKASAVCVRNEALVQHVREHADGDSIIAYLLDIIQYKTGYDPDPNENTPFADMGVDSLRLMELVNIINADLDISLEVNTVLESSTLSGFAKALRNLLWLKNAPVSGEQIII
jgi:acyl-CoA synthetase (AMP-forming)/AMP-acid ligase II/acyl carrier protein